MQTKQEILKEMVDLTRPVVAKIEAGPETTLNHYGEYMSLFAGIDRLKDRALIAKVFKQAGANPQGVEDALMVLGG